ncbi:MAG: sensor histidine kinase, partial [Geopsychrobacter sp.]|nr:sensor histidine kinase [Geopsychrobacter sp.]
MDGQWAFYWQRLLSPKEFSSAKPVPMTDYFSIPGRWDGRVINGETQTGDGYATFRLKVKLKPDRRIMAVRIKEESSAYRLWINGQEVAHNGVVGKSRNAMVPQYLLQ